MINVVWEGSQFANHSLSIVNRETELELIKRTEINLSIIPYNEIASNNDFHRFEQLKELFNKKTEKIDFTVRHKWPPDFSHPEQGKLIIKQPWEVGSMPKKWFEPFINSVDQIWVPSSENKNIYVRDGVPEEKVKVIPLGVKVPSNSLEKYDLQTSKSFKFLFNGGTIYRKGIDILLNAYTEEFSDSDDVCLVIKDSGIKELYPDNFSNEIKKYIDNEKNPEIIYLAKDLSDEELASLYRASDCYVHPYRGEGFGMPIAEAMSHGLPVIVTGYGSALDFCSAENSYLLDYDLYYPPDNFYFDTETVNPPFYPEVKINDLKRKMRYVYNNQHEAIEKGKKGKEFILNNFTWERTAEKVYQYLNELKDKPVLRENKSYYAEKYHNKGKFYFQDKKYKEAINYFKASIILEKKFVESIYYLGLIEYEANNFKESINYFMEAIKSGLNKKECYQILAQSLRKLGDIKTAEMIEQRYRLS